MAANETMTPINTTQVTTTEVTPTTPFPPNQAGPAAPALPEAPQEPQGEPLYTAQGPDPAGTDPQAVNRMEAETEDAIEDNKEGPGIEGEQIVWEARYSLKNFIGRIVSRVLLTAGWIVMAAFTWGYGYDNLAPVTIVVAVALGFYWLTLIVRILQARYAHYYRLTTRRLFVSTGLMRRRRDQMELLRIDDVFTRQTLLERWLSIGTVVVVSKESELPTFYITGVSDPKRVMDLVWHYARAERDHRSVRVQNV